MLNMAKVKLLKKRFLFKNTSDINSEQNVTLDFQVLLLCIQFNLTNKHPSQSTGRHYNYRP